MHRTTTVAALSSLVLLGGLAGCGGDDPEPTGGPSAGPTRSSEPSASASLEPSASESPRPSASTSQSPTRAPFPADLRPDDGGLGSGNDLTVTDVRVGRQDGFDRIVFELAGTGEPGWVAQYVDVPRADGSGDVIDIDGSTFLQVVLRGLAVPYQSDTPGFDQRSVAGTGDVAEVVPGGVFEGQQLAMIGLTGERRPFRVFSLEDPTRVVVDVRTD